MWVIDSKVLGSYFLIEDQLCMCFIRLLIRYEPKIEGPVMLV